MTDQNTENTAVDLKSLLIPFLKSWKVYLISIISFIFLGLLYFSKESSVYQTNSSFMVIDEEDNFSLSSAFQEMGVGFLPNDKKMGIQNHMAILKSRKLLKDVLIEEGFCFSFYSDNDYEIYPVVKIELLSNWNTQTSQFSIIPNESSVEIINNTIQEKYAYNTKINIDGIEFRILKNQKTNAYYGERINISLPISEYLIDEFQKKLNIKESHGGKGVISISIQSKLPQKAEQLLDAITEKFNEIEKFETNKNKIKREEFLTARLDKINLELRNIEEKIATFKSLNSISNVELDQKIFSESIKENQSKLFEIQNQLQLVNFINDYLKENDTYSVLPINIGLENEGLEKLTLEFNNLVIEYNQYKEKNLNSIPLSNNLANKIIELRNSINTSLTNYKKALEIALKEVKKQESKINAQLKKIPSKEKDYYELVRTKKLKEALYIFLMQRKEESSLALASAGEKIQIIDRSYTISQPVYPKKSIFLLVSAILGFLLPTLVIYLYTLFDTKINTKTDITNIIPEASIVAEIPSVKEKKKSLFKDGAKDSNTEAFRILVTNLKFLFRQNPELKSRVILCTSTIAGEGKTYIATFLSSILSKSKDKNKVILIGTDIRKPKFHEHFEGYDDHQAGLSNYLSDPTLDYKNLIVNPSEKHPNLDVLFPGIIPPNPSSLLASNRFKNLIDDLKHQYDYIILDSSPVGLVTDTLLINQFADYTLFVARSKFLEKKLLEIPKNTIDKGQMKNVSFILNDVDMTGTYGYGYGYGHEQDKNWWKKIIGKH
jgi:capsular exopolysaccharide synthesis family protein